MKSKKKICTEFRLNLYTLNKIIDYLKLSSTKGINSYGKETDYYDENKVKEFIDKYRHDNFYGYKQEEIADIIEVNRKSIKNVITYLNINGFICENELNQIKQFYIEHKDDYKTFFMTKTNLEKYGVEYPFQSKVFHEKGIETSRRKYGVDYYTQTDEHKKRIKETNLKKYGVECSLQSDEVKEKIKKTCLERYGFENPSQSEEIKEKVRKTNLERFGVECSLQSDEVKEKVKQTNLKKYGVIYTSQNEQIKEKTKQTNLKRYGVESPFQNEIIKEKIKKTNIERYGVDNVWKSKEIRNKIKKTNLKKYGVEYVYQNKDIQNKVKKTNLEKYGVENPFQSEIIKEKLKNIESSKLKFAKSQNLLSSLDLIHIFNRDLSTVLDVIKRLNINVIRFDSDKRYYISPSDLPILEDYFAKTEMSGISYSEKEIVDFIKSIYNEEIMENTKRIISPKELDIYIPQKKVAIEFDGLYWHDENHIENNYHLNKTIACEEKGIDLIHVFEDDWLNRKEIVKSMIASRLGIYEQKIFARKCKCKILDYSLYKDLLQSFFDENHLQGFTHCDVFVGLTYNDELVQCMGFNEKGWHDGNTELTRMATKINTQVIGGFSKLMKFVTEVYGYKNITSYINRAWFNGKGYFNSGFEVVKINPPNYYYVVDFTRVHKSHFRKDKIKRLYENNLFVYYDENESEHELMLKNEIFRIYDCGTIKVVYKSQLS